MLTSAMTILLTGATGFVGTNFILQLHKKYNIIALVRKTSDIEKIKNYCKIYYYDDTIDSINNVFKSEKIDGVVHLAALYKPTYNLNDFKNMFSVNIYLGSEILECIKIYPIKFFINTATFSQFANCNSYNPRTLYDAMKHSFLDLMKFYYRECSNTVFTSLLLFNPYGLHETTLKIFSLWAQSIKTNEVFKMGEGKQKIDVTYIADIVDAYHILIDLCIKRQVKNGMIYSTENKRYSIRELACLFEQINSVKLPIRWGGN
ncbi:NAD-dependent epimerase/dehydratase family protein [Campylobacter jejuni]|nr:NAD-dependent epimerase/dehydratase family protein [Campylobacter jejuni]EFD8043349.1 NAD-dependent epimerase/dehydratase family protein [Campylobacter jejuni]